MPTGRRGIRYVNKNHELLRRCLGWWKVLPWNAGGAYLVNVLSPGQFLGTRNGGVSWSGPAHPGAYGSLDFDGSSGVVTMTGSFGNAQGPWTIAAWGMMPTYPAGQADLFGMFGPGLPAAQIVYNASSEPFIRWKQWGGVVILDSGIKPATNMPFFVAITTDGSGNNALCYFDSTQSKTVTGTTTLQSGNFGQALVSTYGGVGSHEYWLGYADDCFYHQRVLSSAEVYDLYRETRAGCPNLIPRRRASVIVPATPAGGHLFRAANLDGLGGGMQFTSPFGG